MTEDVLIGKLIPHPKNPNYHSDEQIDRLAKLIQYQGWRLPIIVSKQTGFIVSGHGRLAAAKQLGLKEVPVSFQDFINEEQERAFLISDNAIASWADLDLSAINADIGDLGPDFDLDLLGLQNFLLEPADLEKELWDNEFEGPKENFRIVITVEHKNLMKKVLELLDITNLKNFKEGKVVSVKWPEIKE